MGYRLVHDDIPISRSLNRLGHFAFRLYVLMLSQTDAWGRLTGDPEKIRSLCLPTLFIEEDELHAALVDLTAAERIDLYIENSIKVCQLLDFDERQLVSRMKRAPSRYPARTVDSLLLIGLTLPIPLLDTTDVGPGAFGLGLPISDLRENGSEKPLQNPRSIERQKTEDRKESVLPTAVARNATEDLPVAQQISESLGRFSLTDHDTPKALSSTGLLSPAIVDAAGLELPKDDLRGVASRIRDADDGTVNVFVDLSRKGLPAAAFITALESLEERRKKMPALRSEVRYVVGALKTMLKEGHYGRAAA